MKINIILIITVLYTFPVGAQDIIRLGIQPTDISLIGQQSIGNLLPGGQASTNQSRVNMSTISDKFIAAYATNKKFKVIDLSRTGIINEELERQKSEDFLDGHMTEQGLKEGIDFFLFTSVDPGAKIVTAFLKSVETGETTCKAEVPFISAKYAARAADHYGRVLIEQLNRRCFGIYYTIAKVQEVKNGKLKTVLIAAGHNKNIKSGLVLGIFTIELIEVEDEMVEHEVQIGELKIKKIEGDNFSIGEVSKGNQIVLQHITNKQKVYCKNL